MPKGVHARGYALHLKIKHCRKLFLLEMLCCVLAWMNEYIVQIISATRLWLISRYSHHTHWKSAEKWPPNMDIHVPSDFRHFAYKQIASTWRTNHWFVRGKHCFICYINTHDSCIFDQLIANVCPVCTSDVLQTRTENFEPKNDSIASESTETSRVFRSMHLHYTAILVFFQRSFAWNLKNISPIIWYCNIRCPYKISNILYKTNEKAVSFLPTTPGTSRALSTSAFIFLAAWRVFVRKHQKVCCSLLQWCDVGTVVLCRTCTVRFFRSLLRLYSSFPPIWVCEIKVLWKVASSHAEDLKPVF